MLSYALMKAAQHCSKGRSRHYAVAVDKRGNVIAEAGNLYCKTHTLQARYAKAVGRDYCIGLHAEIHVLALLAKQKKICYTLYIARAKKDGTAGNSMPCSICARALEIAGIFTTNE